MIFKQLISLIHLFLSISILLILSSSLVSAAVISGTVYDLALQQEYDVVVEIDTVPRQLMVAKDGTYLFNVNPGNYTLHAYTALSESAEAILVADDGEYVLDIVLEDNILDPTGGISLIDSEIDVSSSIPSNARAVRIGIILLWALAAVLLLLAIVFVSYVLIIKFIKFRKETTSSKPVAHKPVTQVTEQEAIKVTAKTALAKVEDEYESKILDMIKKEKRTTQKDIRKEIPLSEAKVSLILTDLEDKGKIRKIKKGRGNVLIFVKD